MMEIAIIAATILSRPRFYVISVKKNSNCPNNHPIRQLAGAGSRPVEVKTS